LSVKLTVTVAVPDAFEAGVNDSEPSAVIIGGAKNRLLSLFETAKLNDWLGAVTPELMFVAHPAKYCGGAFSATVSLAPI